MVSINLLPWRRHLARYQQRRIYFLLALVLISNLSIFLLLDLLLAQQIKHLTASKLIYQTKIEKLLNHQNQMLNNQHRKWLISAKSIAERNASLQMMNRLLSTLSQSTGTDVCFSKIERQKEQIFLHGFASSINDLTQCILHWRQSHLFQQVKLNKLQCKTNGVMYFEISAYAKGQ